MMFLKGKIMSMILSVTRDQGAYHWSYMAKCLHQVLQKIIEKREVKKDSVPRSLYFDASDFFEPLSQFLRKEIPKDPPGSAQIYRIASTIAQKSFPPEHQKKMRVILHKFVTLFDSLQEPKLLNSEEMETAKLLSLFLSELAEASRPRKSIFDDYE